MIERNLITEAQKAIKQYPNFEQNEEIIRLLVGRTLFSFHRGFNEVLETVEKIFGKPIFSFIHPDHLPLILRGYADSRYFIEFFNYLIKHDVKLDDKLFAGLLASVFYSKDCLKNAFEKRKINQGIIEDVLFQNDGIYISVENIVYLMQQGFSFNPNEEIGKKHLKSWLKICRKNENLITSIANIIDFYKLNPSEHKDLYLFLASEAASRGGTWEYHDGIKSLGSCSPIPGGYKVKISDLETDISLDDLGSMPSFNINVNMSSNDHIFVSEFLSKKLGRQYPAELIKAFCELKSTYSFFRNISSEIPETHTWLNAFMRAKTLSEVEKLVYELDNLDILFLNLKLLDENPEVKHIIDTEITAQENSNKIITSEQEKAKREVWVNSWFTNIIAKYKTYYTRVELQLAELASLSQQEQMEIGENVKKAPLSLALGIFERFPQLGLDVRFHISSRIWNFDANKLMKYQYYGQQLREPERQYTTDFFENEIKLHPNILNDAELVFRLFINNALPQSVLNDTGKMAELFLSQSPQRQLCLVNIMSESDNKTLRDFTRDMIMRVFYPGTNIFVRDAFAIFASYGIGREDELP